MGPVQKAVKVLQNAATSTLHQRKPSSRSQGLPLVELTKSQSQAHSARSSSLTTVTLMATTSAYDDDKHRDKYEPDSKSEFHSPIAIEETHSAPMSRSTTRQDEEGKVMDVPQARGFWAYLNSSVDPDKSTGPLSAYCFMTGFIDSISFTAIFVWCGFQTGNFCQLALAIARLCSSPIPDHEFHLPDQQALVSLITFNLGAFLGRIGDRMGPHTRLWLFCGTLLQAVLLAGGAIAIWQSGQGSIASNRGDPAWTNVETFVGLGFMSASLGLQGIMGKRLNTQFTTTSCAPSTSFGLVEALIAHLIVVLTTVWCELMSEPKLFSPRHVRSRDHKLLAALSLFLGGFVGRALLDKIGAAGALGVGVGFRICVAAWWIGIGGLSGN